MDFPGGSVVKNLPANARDTRDVGLVPGSGRSPGGGTGNQLQCSCLDNLIERGAWQATVHGVSKSRMQLGEQASLNGWMRACKGTHSYPSIHQPI